MQKLKTASFWLSLGVTVLGLLASNGALGSGTGLQVAGWVATLASLLGVHLLAPAAAPTTITPAS